MDWQMEGKWMSSMLIRGSLGSQLGWEMGEVHFHSLIRRIMGLLELTVTSLISYRP